MAAVDDDDAVGGIIVDRGGGLVFGSNTKAIGAFRGGWVKAFAGFFGSSGTGWGIETGALSGI